MNYLSILPIALTQQYFAAIGTTILAADIGGTKTQLAIFIVKKGGLEKVRSAVYGSRGYLSFVEMVREFCYDAPSIERLSIGIAGPVFNQRVIATNLPWTLDADELRFALDIPYVYLLNDLEAYAYGVGQLTLDDVIVISMGNNNHFGNAAIIAPGTGLGEAGLFQHNGVYYPLASEGGHTTFAPQNEFDITLLQELQRHLPRVSWERVLSGAGIQNIYNFIRKQQHVGLVPPSVYLNNNTAAIICTDAREGCPIALKTFTVFERYLATEAANVVLKFKASNGIFIGGGIVRENIDLIQPKTFREHFLNVGRMRFLLKQTPIYIINEKDIALEGAARYAACQRVNMSYSQQSLQAINSF